jgi:phosphoribosylformylglycinamidine synthase
MIIFFQSDDDQLVYGVQTDTALTSADVQKLVWLFGNAKQLNSDTVASHYVGPRAAMITPWSTNAVEITQNMDIRGIKRIEQYHACDQSFFGFDPMLFQKYSQLNQEIFAIDIQPEPIIDVIDIAAYNLSEGLALSVDEVQYLEQLSVDLSRPLTDAEVFGFSQVNSEHCRHKIFNGRYIIDGVEKPTSLFGLIKETSKRNPNSIVSAYKDNVAFIKGPQVTQFSPERADQPSLYSKKLFDSVLSIKAETHNFPTTVEPFNGAATGSGGEIRDRLAGGQGSLPLAGTAVYMTSYARLTEEKPWENAIVPRPWLYQTPLDILIKASNGASDFGNKFGQPLIAGSLLTFEHAEDDRMLGYDKVIMLAGGVGYGKEDQAIKQKPLAGDIIVVMGGDNYRIGMGGAAVSSADTGSFGSGIELNAIQRSNPEMQKRVANAIRGLVESESNPIVSIHDHGAGGHLNCLSELVEENGGVINLDALPVGDPTLSYKEIIGNESQERMGLVIRKKDEAMIRRIADRERAPMYVVGEIRDDSKFVIRSENTGASPMNLNISDLFGNSPKLIINDQTSTISYKSTKADPAFIDFYLRQVLSLESVACKDWLTNKVDRCVGGRVAKQQCCGAIQLPLNNCGVMALDFDSKHGIATSIGHSPISALIDPAAGSRNSIAEALTNIVWAPLSDGIKSVSLSANWMWPCKNLGEDARLYAAVEACADFAIQLGINIPTGKDSLSMKQKYRDQDVLAPGTVIISAGGHCDDITNIIEPVLKANEGDLYYINMSSDRYQLGGSSLYQVLNTVGDSCPDVRDAERFKFIFNTVQDLIKRGIIAAGHDVGSGGLITSILEMCFASHHVGANINLQNLVGTANADLVEVLFGENVGLLIQVKKGNESDLESAVGQENVFKLGKPSNVGTLTIEVSEKQSPFRFDIAEYRDVWYRTSYLFDKKQSGEEKSLQRYEGYKNQELKYQFPAHFSGKLPVLPSVRPKAAIVREKGSNSERELAHALYLAGFDVRDVHMTDLISGRETLADIQFLGAVGGFSNSDVLGSAKGWAGAFKYNDLARKSLENFFRREDTLSVGICNGCQLFVELGLINSDHDVKPRMLHNDSRKHESAFTSVVVQDNHSVMLQSLAGSTLGVWISHGEGKFSLPKAEESYHIVAKYGYDAYPANPNGSDYNTAMTCSADGRHLVMMPHIERSMFQWNWAYYPDDRQDEVSPWLDAFVNARRWISER